MPKPVKKKQQSSLKRLSQLFALGLRGRRKKRKESKKPPAFGRNAYAVRVKGEIIYPTKEQEQRGEAQMRSPFKRYISEWRPFRKGKLRRLAFLFRKTPVFSSFLASETYERVRDMDNIEVTIMPHHGRDMDMWYVYREDEQGNIYMSVDIKGGGYAKAGEIPGSVGVSVPGKEYSGRAGLVDERAALVEKEAAEFFLKNGIRTEAVDFLIRLKEIVVQDPKSRKLRKLSIKEARKEGYVPESNSKGEQFNPVLMVRALGVNYRVFDLQQAGPEEFRNMLKETFKYLNFSLKLKGKDKFSMETTGENLVKYLEWYGRTMGENVARMHNLGAAHNMLQQKNLTLDARIVDLPTVTGVLSGHEAPVKAKVADLKSIHSVLNYRLPEHLHLSEKQNQHLIDSFRDAYVNESKDEKLSNFVRWHLERPGFFESI
jgi:hypothetical protein